MYHTIKRMGQLLIVLILITMVSTLALFGINHYAYPAAAQEPPVTPTPLMALSDEKLEAWGLSKDLIQTQSGSFDLVVNKEAVTSTVTAGSNITFTIAITNNGNDTQYVEFYDDYPIELQDVEYMFNTTAISNGETKPTWLLTDPIADRETVLITVTGQLTSQKRDVTVKNTAIITPFYTNELTPTNNSDEVSVQITNSSSSVSDIYLPIIFKAPPRVLLHYDDFSSTSSDWMGGDNGDNDDCEWGYSNNEYRIKADRNETCWIPGPSNTNYTYAEYEVTIYASDGDGDFDYGIYMNGDGGDYYYLYRIKPDDDCGWKLIRRDGGSSTRDGDCTGINKGNAKNTLTIIHTRDGKISIYVNGTFLYTRDDGSGGDLDGGKGFGFFVEADSNSDTTIRFDDLRIYSVPQ